LIKFGLLLYPLNRVISVIGHDHLMLTPGKLHTSDRLILWKASETESPHAHKS